MAYRNLTRAKLADIRALRKPAMTPDGVWPDWPHPVEPKKLKPPKTSRTGRYKVARAFKPGSGRYS